MRKIFIAGLIIICSLLMASLLVQQSAEAIEYGTDVLEAGNAGGAGGGKTFDTEFIVTPGSEFIVDVWLRDVFCDVLSGGFWITFDPAKLAYVDATRYAPPWDPACGPIVPDAGGPGTLYAVFCNLDTVVHPDGDADIIVGKVKFRSIASGDTQLRVTTIPIADPSFHLWVCWPDGTVLDPYIPAHTLTIHNNTAEYATDVLEAGNGGGSGAAKTFDTEFAVAQNSEFSVDVWLSDVPCNLLSAGFWIEFDPARLTYVDGKIYTPPWDTAYWIIDASGPGTLMGGAMNPGGITPDGDADVIIGKVKFRSIVPGDTQLRVTTTPDPVFDLCVCWPSREVLDPFIPAHTLAIHTIPADSDGDGVPDSQDPYPNSNMEPLITIQGCSTSVQNIVFPDGSTMSDQIGACAAGAKNHGAFVSCVTQLTNSWKAQGVITNNNKSAIQNCASKAK